MKKHVKLRGVVIKTDPMAEVHSKVSLYTEEGIHYVTIYGGRSIKGKLRGSDTLFTMGRFFLEVNKKNFYKLYDVQVYENCFVLSQHLKSYYIACVCAELVAMLKADQHREQFKSFIDILLYLVDLCKNKNNSKQNVYASIAMSIFLWRSFSHNGWQPPFFTPKNNQGYESEWVLQMPEGNFLESMGPQKEKSIKTKVLQTLQDCDTLTFTEAVKHLWKSCGEKEYDIEYAMQHLLHVWQHVLEKKIWSARFLLKT